MPTHNTVRIGRWEFQQAIRLEILARKSRHHLHIETRMNCIAAPVLRRLPEIGLQLKLISGRKTTILQVP